MNNMKILAAVSAAHVLGKKTDIKLEGSRKRVNIVRNVINASRDLYESMDHSSANILEVKRCLAKKSEAAKKFRNEFGHRWPL
jgi:hypothetical protein